jgi:hydroxycarboxylate dehydrogenase B
MPTTFSAPHLHAYMRDILVAAGVTEHIAEVVAEVLVGANLVGHDSHGLLRIPMYMRSMDSGRIIPDAEPTVLKDNGNSIVMDGNQGHGIFTCMKGAELAIARAKEVGMCGVTFKRIEHIGRLGHFVEMAAHAGCVGFVTVGHGTAGKGSVLPYGSAVPTFNTNPIAWGIPTGDDTPFVLDYATSVVAEGKLRVARSKELEVADGTIVDKAGKPTNNPWDFYDGGALLPFGAHKGSALLMLPCLLGSLGGSFDPEENRAQGCFIMIMDVSRFSDLDTYQKTVRTFLDTVKATEPADGFDEVLVPGDFETRNRKHRLKNGVEVPDLILKELQEWNEKWGVDLDSVTIRPEDERRYRSPCLPDEASA